MKARKLKKLLGLMLAVTLVLPTSQMTVSAKPDSDPQGGSGNRQMAESAAVASQENRESGLVGFQGEYAVSEVDTPVSVIVEFVHQPAELVEAIAEANEEEVDESTKELNALAKKDKEDFYKALEGVNYTVKYEYSLGMNGVAVTVPQSMVDDIAQMECVFAVYPDETHANVIEPEGDYEEEEIAPQSADQFQVFPDTSRESSDAVVE
ncbi:MAG: protease inhibitor I9 family protein, partial [Lachnospiraceae bacterium]|nr:protease inhibitor I9 family protein [Lachnospiraceae bacterium]